MPGKARPRLENFYPRPPRGGRRRTPLALWLASNFYPRPPRGGRRRGGRERRLRADFYPRPPRGGRRPRLAKTPLKRVISIHALREEGDL